MLTTIHPKLPMRHREATLTFYTTMLGFTQFGGNYPDYLMLQKDDIQIHFFLHPTLDPLENYGQAYIRLSGIDDWYNSLMQKNVKTTPLENKPWQQREFSLLDPDHNLLTFGQNIS